MYITQILQYLIWPAFIALSWFAIVLALKAYEKKFPVQNLKNEITGTGRNQYEPGDHSETDR
jgi:hypothetical protein